LGTSGNAAANVELRDLGIDANFSGGATLGAAVQISNGPDFKASNVLVKNCYGGGILLQGFGAAPNGCPRSVVESSRFDTLGQADGSTGHGVTITGQSDHSRVINNTFVNIKGGMGVAAVGSSSGNPDHCTVSGNTVTMAASTIGFEGIGFDVNSTYATITGNNVTNSQDNGISATGPHSTITGNTIDGALNHGIWAAAYSTVTGNTIRNAGKAFTVDGLLYGGVTIDAPIGSIVTGNTILDDRATKTMAYIAKAVNGTLGGNIIGPNAGSGWNQASPYSGFTATTDITIDTHTNTGGITLNRIYGPGATPLILGSTANALSQFWVGNTSTTIDAQMGIRTNSTSRVTAVIKAVTSQTSDLLQIQDSAGAVMAKIGINGSIKANTFATGSRPSAVTVGAGAQVYDTTLSKPIWSDGTVWRDAAGTAV
jgi:putative cofactor-binding repeat protein